MGKKSFPASSRKESKKFPTEVPISSANLSPIWRFDLLDKAGKFAFDLNRSEFDHREVLEKLVAYGNMKWREIDLQTHGWNNHTKHHFLSVSGISMDGRSRIQAKNLEDDTDAIYSLALNGLIRIIGIRKGAEFHIVWYDPKHEFYPTSKKQEMEKSNL